MWNQRPIGILKKGRYSIALSTDELKNIFMPVFAKSCARMVYLFGSQARGTADPESDVDLVIVADTERPFVERCKDFIDLIGVSPVPVEMLVYTRNEFQLMHEHANPFILHVLTEGKLLYERSGS
jgi:predicted nucleotidyltransferase